MNERYTHLLSLSLSNLTYEKWKWSSLWVTIERVPNLIHFANIVGAVENAQNRATYLMVIVAHAFGNLVVTSE